MTMVLDTQARHYGGIGYDHMYPNTMHAQPQFTDPWSHQTGSHTGYPAMSKPDTARTSLTMPYSQLPTSAPLASDIPRSNYGDHQYSAPAATQSSYATAFPALSYAQSLHDQQQQQAQQQRKMSQVSTTSDSSRAATASFGELDASRGMLALSHQSLQDLTPRNIYEARAGRGTSDAYGFPQPASSHSSISNESGRGYPYYSGSSVSSVADSATDYSSAASDAGYDSMASRTLPRPTQLMGAPLGPPAPQSMMGQFSSKLSANTQKKHKCKVCDKRFTRPSSLQTHMYSHTGEKPFACNVEGCGRHFSVVSNLRRHKKVHKNDTSSNHSDGED